MEKNITPKKYEIDSFERLINIVNKENIERLSIDFLIWLNYVTEVIEKTRETYPDIKDKTNWELFQPTFNWVDDGKNEILGVKIINQETGEVSEIKNHNP
jgi:hypothetical protein